MAYQVLARKWRPKKLSELIGQDHVATTLFHALRNNRLPHALVFSGVRGTGKTSTARILAKALRCPNSVDFEPCQVCSECQDIAVGRAVDVIEIDGASNNGVDAIRELRDTVGFRPSSGAWKVYIIDEVHMLSTSAFNALLKTLEEPPENVVFILATTDPQKIPQTVLSRCQRYDFRRIPTKAIADHLTEICRQEGFEVESEALWMLARQADGSMRDSQSLLDQALSFSEGKLSAQKLAEVLNLTDRNLVQSFTQAIFEKNHTLALNALAQVHEGGQSGEALLAAILELLRHLLVLKLVSQANANDIIDLPDSEVAWLKGFAEKVSAEDLHLLFDMTLKGLADVAGAQEQRLVFDVVILRLLEAPRVRTLMDLFAQSAPPVPSKALAAEPTSTKSATIGALAPKPSSEPASSGQPVNLQSWTSFVFSLKQKDALLAAKIEPLIFSDFQNQTLSLGVPLKLSFLKDQILEKSTAEKLKKMMTLFWKQDLQFQVQVERDPKGLSVQKLEESKKKEELLSIQDQVNNHPKLKSMKAMLNAEVQSIQPLQKSDLKSGTGKTDLKTEITR